MDPQAPSRQPVSERLTIATLAWTWVLWLVGGLYIAAPVLGWTLFLLVLQHWFIAPALPLDRRPHALPGWLIGWLAGMAAMLMILLIGHANFDLGAGQTLKSAIGWAKGWALLALFPLAGYVLPVRMEALVRASCRLGRITLFLLPLFLIAPWIGLPQNLWVSPLKVLGGSGDEYFSVVLYTLEPGTGVPRWQFFAPWSPAAGLVGMVQFILAREEPDRRWRWTGYAAALAIILLSQSRLAMVALAVVVPLSSLVRHLHRPASWLAFAPLAMLSGWFGPQLLAFAQNAADGFSGARAASSRVRATLGRIAVERWQSEAWWFGHGVVEKGPHLVEYMPIGSHHSWFGLLFVKGAAGVIALAVPMGLTLLATLRLAMRNRRGRIAVAMTMVWWLYSFGENLEVVVYLAWPGLLALGIAFRPELPAPSEG